MSNPLLSFTDLPPFSEIKPEHIKPAVEKAIADCREAIEKVLAGGQAPSWDTVCGPLAESDDRLGRIWSPVGHMNGVVNSAELREAYESCLPLLSDYSTWVGQHKPLYEAYKAIKDSAEFDSLTQAKQKAITDALRDFELTGIALLPKEQHRFGDKPALFTHDEVVTLFHEFGHGIHHMLTRVDVASVSGINGVAWDAVELPSQFLENWCWEEEALAFISGHFETGEPLPKEKLDKMLAAKNFQSAMGMLRQMEFSLFDFTLFSTYDPEEGAKVLETLADIKSRVAVMKSPEWNRFPHAFSHIFAGGYSAGYYSYMWAEVLSSDAFSRFEEEGIFNTDTGASFLENILERGGSEEPMTLFKRFRGREPSPDALLRHSGITG